MGSRPRRKRRPNATVEAGDLLHYLFCHLDRDPTFARMDPSEAGEWFMRMGWTKRPVDAELLRRRLRWLDEHGFVRMPDRLTSQREIGSDGHYRVELAAGIDVEQQGSVVSYRVSGAGCTARLPPFVAVPYPSSDVGDERL